MSLATFRDKRQEMWNSVGAGNESRLTRRKGRGSRPPEDYYNGPLQWLEGADHPGGQHLILKRAEIGAGMSNSL